MRAAIYFTPKAEALATSLAASWLGRDAFTGESTPPVDKGRASITASPARYGFHATMKAPFRLADGATPEEIDRRLAEFCATEAGTEIGKLVLRRLGSFLALVPADEEPDLDRLCAAAVRGFEPFRAPLTEAEIARRDPEALSERQRRHLTEWGYPYVFEDFRFHMTLTGRLAPNEAEAVEDELRQRFAPVLDRPLPIDGLALFVEPEPGAPFRVHSRHSFRRTEKAASA